MTELLNKNISSKLIERAARLAPNIGNTPLFDFSSYAHHEEVKIFAKVEWQQFGGSVKSRAAFQIIQRALEEGSLNEGISLLDATSGNTGIAYAAIGANLGIPITICLPENASNARKKLLKAYGAKVVYTSAQELTEGAQDVARSMKAANPDDYFYADQYSNEANWKAHYYNTAGEIWQQTHQEISHFVAGLGTTGTITGNGKRLKELNPEIEVIGLQPDNPMHFLEGWKHLESVGRVPAIYDETVVDRMATIYSEEIVPLMLRVARQSGLLLSPSAAANLQGAIDLSLQIRKGSIVTVLADDASKYEELYNQILH